jgi:uncharacterized protein
VAERVHHPPTLIYSAGTQVVTLVELPGTDGHVRQPRGAVGVVVKAPADFAHGYRIRFPDGLEASFARDQVTMLARYKENEVGRSAWGDLADRVIYRCVIGSRAYGLDTDASDTDRRGIYLPSAERHWSLAGVPEQLENEATQESYWELQKFLVMALKANPNVLECLYSPLVEHATPLARELLAMRECFLSKLVYQTFNGYVLSQFKKMQAGRRNHGEVKWKHVMHLLRLLISGIGVLRYGVVTVRVGDYRGRLLAIRRGEVSWDETEAWRLRLHAEFDAAHGVTRLPDRPDYAKADALLVKARRLACEEALP